MSEYKPPVDDAKFVLHRVFKAPQLWAELPGCGDWNEELANAVLEEVAKVSSEVLAPLNSSGDAEGVTLQDGEVRTPAGFAAAYRAISGNGWLGFLGSPDYGGQGAPNMLDALSGEMFSAANTSFSLYTGLTVGVAHALHAHATESVKTLCLPKLYSGTWAGCMCLTEAHAGTDLGIIRTRAQEDGPDRYRISGTKIFITAGEHDLSENILYLVLAKLPDAPAGSKGISMFLVSKFLYHEDGTLGERNGVRCLSVEDKMGIHASPTCVMQFEDAQGFLVGEPHKGLAAMFTMMNQERLFVGLQGLACGAAAYQKARDYALERIQGRATAGPVDTSKEADPIIVHPDVRRMLLTQKALIEGGRAFAVYMGMQLDLSQRASGQARKDAEILVALLTPVVKSFLSDRGFEGCVLAQQVFGGHGYIREWGVEQRVRDVRITQIYEGTNGIQALDLMRRKVVGSGGQFLDVFLQEIRAFLEAECGSEEMHPYAQPLTAALALLEETTAWVLKCSGTDPNAAGAASVEYLDLLGYTIYAYMWARMARAALEQMEGDDTGFCRAKLQTADFFMSRLLPRTVSLAASIRGGGEPLMAMDATAF